MPFKFFTVPIQNARRPRRSSTGFSAVHRVLAVDRRWVEQGATSFWSFCVDYLEHAAGSGTASSGRRRVREGGLQGGAESRGVRGLRPVARAAQGDRAAEAVPVYTIFTNEQLAQMVQSRATTKAALEKIAGVGDARIEKYGTRGCWTCSQGAGAGTAPMKRAGNLFERVVDRDNLRLAVGKAMRGKRYRPEVAQFLRDLDQQPGM